MNKVNMNADWQLETTNCPLCASDKSSATPFGEGPFRVRHCESCEFYFLSPRLTAEAANNFYEGDNYFSNGGCGSGYEDYSVQEKSLRATFRILLNTLQIQGATGGALLEVGSGPGYLLDEARSFFDTCEGVELSPPVAEAAQRLTGATIYLSNADIDPEARYDCIIATHVIEHIYEPVAFVETLADHLKPSGSFVLAAPDMGSILRRVMGKRWPSWKFPEHVSFFDTHSLPNLFDRSGLQVIERVPYPHVFPLSLVLSKLGIWGPEWTRSVNVTLPATTISYRAQHRSA